MKKSMKGRNWLYILFLLIFSTSMQAQFESSKKKIKLSIVPKKEAPKTAAVAPPKPPKADEPSIKYESQFLKNPEDKLLKSISKTPQVGIPEPKTYEVKKASELYADKFNKKEGPVEERFKSDTFLGQFSTGSKTVRIACRDHEAPDGDVVRVWVNDKVAVNEILLDVAFKELFLELQEGFNKIEFEALNQGESGPNTAQFVIVDDKGTIITTNKWNLTTGVKAKVIVVKEKDMLIRQ